MGEKDFEQSVASTRANTHTGSRTNTTELRPGGSPSAPAMCTEVNTHRSAPGITESVAVHTADLSNLMGSEQKDEAVRDTKGFGKPRRQLLYC